MRGVPHEKNVPAYWSGYFVREKVQRGRETVPGNELEQRWLSRKGYVHDPLGR